MPRAWLFVALVAWSVTLPAQTLVTLRVEVTLPGAAQAEAPVPRHTLLVSDNPATAPPRRVVTGADGVAEVRLRPGSYTVESDQPVVLQGRVYQWTEIVDVGAPQGATLRLTAANAEVISADALSSGTGAPASSGTTALLVQWQEGIAAVWSPTMRVSAFLVDESGLLVTSRAALGTATDVAVQVTEPATVPARVVFSNVSNGAAVVWVNPAVVSGRPVLPLQCPPPRSAALEDGQEVAALGWPLRRLVDVTWGEVTGVRPRAVDTDLRVQGGAEGGPVFNAAGEMVGIAVPPADADSRDAQVVRAGTVCEAVAAARASIADQEPPAATTRSLPAVVPFPAGALAKVAADNAPALTPPAASSDGFDITFLTPPVIYQTQQRAGRTGGTRTRDPEAEMRLGRIVEFGAWSEYFADLPSVLVVRVTPKLVEGFWQRLARGAAMTQGAILPAFKDFRTSFARMQMSCDGVEVPPLHPFVLEHRLSDTNTLREGLHVFAPEAIGPHCGTVTLTVHARGSTRGDTITVPPAIIERIAQDFEAQRGR